MVRSATFDPGAAHASDVPYLFDLLGRNYLRAPTQTKLSNTMIDYWTSFARTGTPAAAGQPAWPRLTGVDGPTLRMNSAGIKTTNVAAEHQCHLWATITGPSRH